MTQRSPVCLSRASAGRFGTSCLTLTMQSLGAIGTCATRRSAGELLTILCLPLAHTPTRSIEELEAPNDKHTPSANLICWCTVEKECGCEASQNASFSSDHPSPATEKDLRPSAEFAKCTRSTATACNHNSTAVPLSDDLMSEADNNVFPSLRSPLFSDNFGLPASTGWTSAAVQTLTTTNGPVGNLAPGDVKAECSNCSATHMHCPFPACDPFPTLASDYHEMGYHSTHSEVGALGLDPIYICLLISSISPSISSRLSFAALQSSL